MFQPIEWGDIGPAILAHLARMSALDTKIMRAWRRPEREAMEDKHGTKAEAGTHGAIGTTDSELVADAQLKQMSRQALDRWRVTNYGPDAPVLRVKQAPLSDPQQQFLQEVAIALIVDKTTGPGFQATFNQRALGDRVEIPLLSPEDAEAAKAAADELAAQQNAAPPAAPAAAGPEVPAAPPVKLSADDGLLERLAAYITLGADEPLELAAGKGKAPAKELTGGEWKTIDGAHVYIKNGTVVAGPQHLIGKTHSQVESHGATPTKDKEGYHAIERNAVGKYKGTRGEDGKIEHVQEHADRLEKTKAQPGHTSVYLSKDPNADAPVVGTDVAGRTQAPQSAAATTRARDEKFSRNDEFHAAMPQIRKRLAADLHGDHAEEAAVLSLIDKTGFRIGGDEDTGAKVKAFGASTLKAEHVTINGDEIHFQFTGKKGVAQDHILHDSELAKMLAPRVAKGGDLFDTNDAKSGKYLKKISGNEEFKNKDFRTEVGTETARQTIAKMPVPTTINELKAARKAVSEVVAKKLGNNPSEALKSYINPNVFKKWVTVYRPNRLKTLIFYEHSTNFEVQVS